MTLFLLLSLMLLLFAGRPEGVDDAKVKDDLRQRCYSVGTCKPSFEPDGSLSESCSIFTDAVTCLQRAVEACRMLRFPADTLAAAESKIKELRGMLSLECSAHSTTVTQTPNDTLPSTSSTTIKSANLDSGSQQRHVENGAVSSLQCRFSTTVLVLLCVARLLSKVMISSACAP